MRYDKSWETDDRCSRLGDGLATFSERNFAVCQVDLDEDAPAAGQQAVHATTSLGAVLVDVWMGIGIVAIGWLLFLGYRHSARLFRQAKADWLRTWLCFSCGGSCRSDQ